MVVHLDLPWTPARLAQRVGRAARLGATHPIVAVYGQRPPGPVADWLRVARRLRAKAAAARGALGATVATSRTEGDGRSIRADGGADLLARRIGLARRAATHRLLERWLVESDGTPDSLGRPATAHVAVRCGHAGLVAVWHPGGRGPPLLVAALDDHSVTDAPGRVARALRLLALPGAEVAAPRLARWRAAEASVRAWAARRSAAELAGLGPEPALAWAARREDGSTVTGRPPHPSATPPRCLHCRPPCLALHGREVPDRLPGPPCSLARASAVLRAAPPHARASLALALGSGTTAPDMMPATPPTHGASPEPAKPRLVALVLLLP